MAPATGPPPGSGSRERALPPSLAAAEPVHQAPSRSLAYLWVVPPGRLIRRVGQPPHLDQLESEDLDAARPYSAAWSWTGPCSTGSTGSTGSTLVVSPSNTARRESLRRLLILIS
jgi:hypothetical protein